MSQEQQTNTGGGTEWAASAILLEKRFKINHYTGSLDGTAPIIIPGTLPILLSCPHAVKHPRWGRLKVADGFTGTLGTQLTTLSGAHGLIYSCTSTEDPNYDADGPYKRLLSTLIKERQIRFVLDLHGMARSVTLDFALGTAHGAALAGRADLLEVVQTTLQREGFQRVALDDPRFNASNPNNIASFVSRTLRIPALQLEIHKGLRDPEHDPANYIKLLHTLSQVLSSLARVL